MKLHVSTADDWPQARDLRLEMLADTPIAFMQRLEDARAWTDQQWQERHQGRAGNPASRTVAVVDDDGTWRGQMSVYDTPEFPADNDAWLVSVYVSPPLRGTEWTDRLLAVIVEWAVARGHDRLLLDVHEANPRAIAAYVKRGFVDTGGRTPYPLEPGGAEIQMALDLTGR